MWTAKLALAAALIAPPAAEPPTQQVVVAARPAIMRILEADNLDVDSLSASEVADRMSDITQGAAPAEFWKAYQAHVRAWQDYAAAKRRVREADALTGPSLADAGAIVGARTRINGTFDVVEAIARRYEAWPPRTQTRL
jgi:hypothetical protein